MLFLLDLGLNPGYTAYVTNQVTSNHSTITTGTICIEHLANK